MIPAQGQLGKEKGNRLSLTQEAFRFFLAYLLHRLTGSVSLEKIQNATRPVLVGRRTEA